MEDPVGVPCQLGTDLFMLMGGVVVLMLVGGVVVEDGVDLAVGREGAVDLL